MMADDVALSFIQFCLERLPTEDRTWPRLYDEMCAVARRQLFRQLDYLGLANHGVSLGLNDLNALRRMAARLDSRFTITSASLHASQ